MTVHDHPSRAFVRPAPPPGHRLRPAWYRAIAAEVGDDIARGYLRDLEAGMPEAEALALAERRRRAFEAFLTVATDEAVTVARAVTA